MEAIALIVIGSLTGGFALGFLIAYLLRGTQAKDARALAEQLLRRSEAERKAHDAQILEMLKGQFSSVSIDLMTKTQRNFMDFAAQRLNSQGEQQAKTLESKKELIDQSIDTMNRRLRDVTQLIAHFEEKRSEKLGALGRELEQLTQTSALLQRALANNKARGQWGERIADDLLRMMGFIEGVNYVKQATSNTGEKNIRPDFTFNLPNGMLLNMDSKFPLDNYLAFLAAESDADQANYRRKFLTDVRARIKEVCDRGYINTHQNTIDCVLIFIPNEQIYRFIHEQDDNIIDTALKQKVILCSPLTLFIVLAVVRQSVENFKLHESSREVLNLLEQFKREWDGYVNNMDSIGNSLDKARSAYDDVIGKRRRALEKPLQQIDSLLHDNRMNDRALSEKIAN